MNKIILPKSEMPKQWYNCMADLPGRLEPPLSPEDNKPLNPKLLENIFPKAIIAQEMGLERFYNIPSPVQEALSLWRPTPLVRAIGLEKALGVKSKIFYKDESVSPSGSHKSNSAVAQVYYNNKEGITRLTTETGAGQWGTALAMAGQMFNMEIIVYMVKVSYFQKPYRKLIMNLFWANVFPSPSEKTAAGRKALQQDPNANGSLGLAISEAIEEAKQRKDTNYALGSVLNHVLLHQTVIGQEAKKQLEMAGIKPDYLIACHGGGSNFGGLVAPFVPELLEGKGPKVIAAEPSSCPSLSKGEFRYDFADTSNLTPLLKMYTLGCNFQPPAIHAAGLRFHGSSPVVSALLAENLIEPQMIDNDDVFKYARLFAKTQSLIPAPESGHAIAASCLKALELEREKEAKNIIFCLSGHGLLDMSSYEDALNLGNV